MNHESNLKRFLKNLFSLTIILSVAIGAFYFYEPNQTKSSNSSGYPTDIPQLISLSQIEGHGFASNGKYDKQFAFEVNESATELSLAADILEVYRWGRSQYGDISSKCYTDPSTSCKVGRVAIFLLLPNSKTDKYQYDLYAAFFLDQDAIDQLLFGVEKDGLTLSAIDMFHKNLYQTEDTGFFQKPIPWLVDLPINLK